MITLYAQDENKDYYAYTFRVFEASLRDCMV
jgi:hypothetical protein